MFKVALFLLSRLHIVQKATPFFQVNAHWHKQYGEGHAPIVGIILDSVAMESRLPVNKLKRISGMLKQFLHTNSGVKRELLSLLGHLVFASRVIIPGRTFMSRLFEASKGVKHLYHRVNLATECKADIKMWCYLLSHWNGLNGVSMFLDSEPTFASDLHLLQMQVEKLGMVDIFKASGSPVHGIKIYWLMLVQNCPLGFRNCTLLSSLLCYGESLGKGNAFNFIVTI